MTIRCIIYGSDGEKGRKAEDLVAEKYRIRGYQVWNNTQKDLPEEVDDELREVAEEKGAPDLLVKDGDEYGFVEVKSNNGSLRLSQLKWMASHGRRYPIDVAHLDEDGERCDFHYNEVVDEVGREIRSLRVERDKLEERVETLREERDKILKRVWELENKDPEKLKNLLRSVLEVLEHGQS